MNEIKKEIKTTNAPTPAGPYSQALVTGDFVFVAGQRPTHPATGEMASDIAGQTEQCIKNVEQILIAAGSSLANVVRSNVYLSDLSNFAPMNEVYSKMFPQPYPVRTTIGCQLRGILIEIEVIAKLNK